MTKEISHAFFWAVGLVFGIWAGTQLLGLIGQKSSVAVEPVA